MADGDLSTARDATLYLFERQQLADGSMPRNSLVNGKLAPDSFGTQLDETAYPLLMADELHLTDAALYADHVKPAANFIISHGPSFGAERWEEQSGYSPSTIAAEIAGLVAAADLADAQPRRRLGRGLARRRRRLPALDQGLDGDDDRPASPRATSSASRRPATRTQPSTYDLGNGGPTRRPAHGDRRRVPRARAARRAARDRPGHPRDPAGGRLDDPLDHRERARLAPLQRRRLRRPLERRPPVGTVRRRHRPSLAGALVGARGAVAADGRCVRRGVPARLDGAVRGRRRTDSRAGLGDARIWRPHRSGHRPRPRRSAS